MKLTRKGLKKKIKKLKEEKRELKEKIFIKDLLMENIERYTEAQHERCYKEAGLTPDCNPVYCINWLKALYNQLLKEIEKQNPELYKEFKEKEKHFCL